MKKMKILITTGLFFAICLFLFYSGPAGKGDPVKLLDGRIFPGNLKPTLRPMSLPVPVH